MKKRAATGQVALVTGGAGGIGRAIGRRLAQGGARVVLAGRRAQACEEAAEGLRGEGGEAFGVTLDVTDPASIEAALARVRAELGPVAWLVNNAGVAKSAPLIGTDDALYAEHFDVNFHGPRRMLEAVLPDLRAARGGRVVQIASSAALYGYAYVAAYVASKHALLGYSRCAAQELASKRVAVDVVCPWYVDSPMTDESARNIAAKTGCGEEEARAQLAGQNPGGVLVTPEEVAEATWELLAGDYTGRVVELIGGDSRIVEQGRALEPMETR